MANQNSDPCAVCDRCGKKLVEDTIEEDGQVIESVAPHRCRSAVTIAQREQFYRELEAQYRAQLLPSDLREEKEINQ